MNATRWRGAVLLLAVVAVLLAGPEAARADVVLLAAAGDYEPVEPAPRPAAVEGSALPVLLATFLGFPPVQTVQEQVEPTPTPTVVTPDPVVVNTPTIASPSSFPTIQTSTSSSPTQQMYPGWTVGGPAIGPVGITHTPEPTSLLSGLLGLGLLGWYRRGALAAAARRVLPS